MVNLSTHCPVTATFESPLALTDSQFKGKISTRLRFTFIEELKSADKESLCVKALSCFRILPFLKVKVVLSLAQDLLISFSNNLIALLYMLP